jgi:hypothetical protein
MQKLAVANIDGNTLYSLGGVDNIGWGWKAGSVVMAAAACCEYLRIV